MPSTYACCAQHCSSHANQLDMARPQRAASCIFYNKLDCSLSIVRQLGSLRGSSTAPEAIAIAL